MLPYAVVIVLIAGVLFSAVPLCEMYRFRIEPLRPSVMEGDAVTLVCEVANTIDDEEYILIWRKDGVNVAQEHSILGPTIQPGHRFEADLVPTTSGFMYVLKINPVKVVDAGEYSCLAEERMKVRTESPQHAILRVNQIPGSQYPKCLSEIDGGFPEGEEVTITCVSELVTPPVTLKWRLHGKTVPSRIEKDAKNGLLKAHYTFTPTPDDDGNIFVCEMTSTAMTSSKPPQCDISPLVVLHKPIIRIRHSGEVHVGKESVFICESIANPRSTSYEWNVSSELLDKVVIDDNTHQILRLIEPSTSESGGQITCLATNSMGTSSESVIMDVRQETDDTQHSPDELTDDLNGIYDYSGEGDFLGVPTSIAILGLSGVIIFLLFLTITPVCYCCLCSRPRLFSSKESVAQPDVYFVPKDSQILQQVPTSDDLAAWTRSVASQMPDDWEEHYSEIGGRPLSLKYPKCSCV